MQQYLLLLLPPPPPSYQDYYYPSCYFNLTCYSREEVVVVGDKDVAVSVPPWACQVSRVLVVLVVVVVVVGVVVVVVVTLSHTTSFSRRIIPRHPPLLQ